jgi:NADH-quinone oxidoreductase subunit N
MSASESFQLQDLICITPILFLFIASLLPITVKVLRGNTESEPTVSMVMAALGTVGAVVAAGVFLFEQKEPYFAFSKALIFDGVSVLSTVIIAAITFFAIVTARENKATNGPHFSEFLFLLLNSAIGMMVMAWSNDLIITFIGIELMSLCLYLVIALSREAKLSKEAAFKYFVLGSFASAIFLYGIAFIYGVTGTTYLDKVVEAAPQLISENRLFLVGVVFAILGFCFKAAIVPFHAWAPDVYEGSPTPVTGFMATGVKLVTFVAFLRLVRGDYLSVESTHELVDLLQWLAVITMCVGNIAAIIQSSLKRMLAYSSIAHSGYVLIGVIAAAVGGEGWRGDFGVIYYVLAYTIMTLGAFGFVCLLEKREGDIILVDDLKGLAKRNPAAALMFALFLLSLAGIPPLVGFFGKFFLFSAAIKQGLFWLAFWGAINSVISAYYYLRPIMLMYMKDESGADVNAQSTHMTQILVGLMAALVVVLGIATEPLYQQIRKAIQTLL